MKLPLYLAIFLSILIAGCSSLHFDKKRYSRGYHVSSNKKISNSVIVKKEAELKPVEQSSIFEHQLQTSEIADNIEIVYIQPSKQIENDSVLYLSEKTETEELALDNDFQIGRLKTVVNKKINPIQSSSAISQETSNSSRSLLFFLFALSAPFAHLFFKKRRVSKWAMNNVNKARFAIAGIHIGIIGSSLLLGMLVGASFASWMMPIILITSVLSILSMGLKGKFATKEKTSVSFFKRNLLAVGNAFSAFIFGGSHSVLSGSGGEILMHPLGVVILTICLTVLLLLSFFGLVLLSCEIACAGYGVLAGVVLFSGAFLFSFFYSLALLHIYKTESSDTDTFVKKSAKAALILILTTVLLVAIGS